MTPSVTIFLELLTIHCVVIFCSSKFVNHDPNSWPNQIPFGTLRACCRYQNSFFNGSCSNFNKTQKYPNWIRNQSTGYLPTSCHRYVKVNSAIRDLKFADGNIITSTGEEYKESEFCVDRISSVFMKLIVCAPPPKQKLRSIHTCCPEGSTLTPHGTKYKCQKFILQAEPNIRVSTRSTANFEFEQLSYLPQCDKYLTNLKYEIREDGQVIISGPFSQSEETSLVWLSLNAKDFCINRVEQVEKLNITILVCHEAFLVELGKIRVLLKKFIHDTIASSARTTGCVSIVSAIFLAFAIAIYLLLWSEHNVHGWTQLSFLIALFLTYFVGGTRRLIGYEVLQDNGLAVIFEALEDFAAVSTSANLVALSFDLLFTLCRSFPTHSKSDGLRRFVITTALAWSTGIIVMITGLILKSGQNDELNVIDLASLTKHLRRLLEFFLCIQNDMLLSICLPVVQIHLFFLNLILFLASVIVLYRKQRHTKLAFENIPKSSMIHFWIRRISKLFLLMGLWWPLTVICVFECIAMAKYTVTVWKQVLGTFYDKPDHVDYVIPWHMYFTSNCLAVQAIVICIIFVWNRKTLTALKKRYPDIYSLAER